MLRRSFASPSIQALSSLSGIVVFCGDGDHHQPEFLRETANDEKPAGSIAIEYLVQHDACAVDQALLNPEDR